jgi:hypothetical protein
VSRARVRSAADAFNGTLPPDGWKASAAPVRQ